jgi:hypothetical protein
MGWRCSDELLLQELERVNVSALVQRGVNNLSALPMLHVACSLQLVTDDDEDDDMDDSSYDGGSDYGRRSPSLTPAGRWWACKAAAAVAAFGASLATSTAAGNAGNDNSSSSSSSSRSKLHNAGLSLAARGLLCVSRNVTEGSSCAADDQQGAQQASDLLSSSTSSCRVLQATLAELDPEGRGALPGLHDRGQALLDRFTEGAQGQSGGQSVQGVLTGAAGDLEEYAVGVAAQLPASFGCNYPGES